jgi:hypothetical protein
MRAVCASRVSEFSAEAAGGGGRKIARAISQRIWETEKNTQRW